MSSPGTITISFIIGGMFGALVGGFVGYYIGKRRCSESFVEIDTPQFRIFLAFVITFLWAVSQLLSLLTGTTVDPWLNGIMGAVAGFFFGEGFMESRKKK